MTKCQRDARLWQKEEKVPTANIFIDKITKAITLLKHNMQQAMGHPAKYASTKAHEHSFQPGQRVLLSSKVSTSDLTDTCHRAAA